MVQLHSGDATATINPIGAWIETLIDEAGPVFFPRTTLRSENGGQKERGGMHVCLPNFGPGGDSNLVQHGFGRTASWDARHIRADTVEFHLNNQAIPYDKLQATLHYKLVEREFQTTLRVENTGTVSLRLAPAFHPYFYLDETETAISVNGTTYELAEIGGTEFITSDSVSVRTAGRSLELAQQGLSTWAIWTDGLANYACVEPTLGGFRFKKTPGEPDEYLAPQETREYSTNIRW